MKAIALSSTDWNSINSALSSQLDLQREILSNLDKSSLPVTPGYRELVQSKVRTIAATLEKVKARI